jgi:hypothetical protein
MSIQHSISRHFRWGALAMPTIGSALPQLHKIVQKGMSGVVLLRMASSVSELDLRAASKQGRRVATTYPQHPIREADAALAVALVAIALVSAMRTS